MPEGDDGANPTVVVLNVDGAPAPIVTAKVKTPVVEPPRVEPVAPTEVKKEEPPAQQEDAGAHSIFYETVNVADDDPSRLGAKHRTAEAPPPAVSDASADRGYSPLGPHSVSG